MKPVPDEAALIASWRRAELEFRKPQGEVDTDLALDRLESDRAVRAAEQDVGAPAHPNSDVTARAHIGAGKAAPRRTFGRREHGTSQSATPVIPMSSPTVLITPT